MLHILKLLIAHLIEPLPVQYIKRSLIQIIAFGRVMLSLFQSQPVQ